MQCFGQNIAVGNDTNVQTAVLGALETAQRGLDTHLDKTQEAPDKAYKALGQAPKNLDTTTMGRFFKVCGDL